MAFGQIRKESIDFLISNVLRIFCLLPLFMFFRLYLFYKTALTITPLSWTDFLQMNITGLRFDLCVLGFILIPIYLIFLVSIFIKSNTLKLLIINFGKLISLILGFIIFLVYFINVSFFLNGSAQNRAFWMRYEDYVELGHYLNIVSRNSMVVDYSFLWNFQYFYLFIILFAVLYMTLFMISPFVLSVKRPNLIAVLIFLMILLMSRGKLGSHHLRYEDSLISQHKIYNELAMNPLWIMNKSVMDR